MVDVFDPKQHYDKTKIGPPEIDGRYYSISQAAEIFSQIAGDARNPFSFMKAHCATRQELAILSMMNHLGISSGAIGRAVILMTGNNVLEVCDPLVARRSALEKLLDEGAKLPEKRVSPKQVREWLESSVDLREWYFHTAATIEVKAAGREIPLVMDPSVAVGPLSIENWLGAMHRTRAQHLVTYGKMGSRPRLCPEFIYGKDIITAAAETLRVANNKTAVIKALRGLDAQEERKLIAPFLGKTQYTTAFAERNSLALGMLGDTVRDDERYEKDGAAMEEKVLRELSPCRGDLSIVLSEIARLEEKLVNQGQYDLTVVDEVLKGLDKMPPGILQWATTAGACSRKPRR